MFNKCRFFRKRIEMQHYLSHQTSATRRMWHMPQVVSISFSCSSQCLITYSIYIVGWITDTDLNSARQCFSTFLMLRPYNIISCCDDPDHKSIFIGTSIFNYCNFVTVMNHMQPVWKGPWLRLTLCKVMWPVNEPSVLVLYCYEETPWPRQLL